MFLQRNRTNGALLAAVAFISVVLLSGHALASDRYVKYHSLIPQLLWCQGCTPTSASMVMGYWDNYVPGVGHVNLGAGRIVDYWRLMPEWRSGAGALRNVPNTQAELIKAMHTDSSGGTWLSWISPGIKGVANTVNHYGFQSRLYMGSVKNKYCWTIIMSEIDHGRPFVWSCGATNEGHSLCAWGYTTTKYVIVYNTWNYGRDDWYFHKYNNGARSTYQSVNTVIPAKLTTANSLFIRPLSGTSHEAGQRVTVSWIQYGGLITRAAIYRSFDGGATWSKVTLTAHSRAGNNYYRWTIPGYPSTRCRLKIIGYHGSSTIAADGLKKNFAITSAGP